jgi:hypothetical protein
VTFADWNRLVDLFERQMRSLVSHGVPVGIQAAAFDKAVRRVVRSLDERPRVFWLSPGVPIGTQIAAFDEAFAILKGSWPRHRSRPAPRICHLLTPFYMWCQNLISRPSSAPWQCLRSRGHRCPASPSSRHSPANAVR